MMKFLFAFILLMPMAFARPLNVTQKISDLDELIAQINVGYGPLQYKKSLLGTDVQSLRGKYVEEIKNTKNNSEFYYLMVRFVAEFQDSHFRASLPTDLVTSLGFSTDLVT